MSIKSELSALREPDIWSMMLFVLSKVKDVPEYGAISELAYILDKKSLLKFCEYFGGTTIEVPTINDLEMLLYGLLLFQYVDVEKMSIDDALQLIHNSSVDSNTIKSSYGKIKKVLENYSFSPRTHT